MILLIALAALIAVCFALDYRAGRQKANDDKLYFMRLLRDDKRPRWM